MLTLLISLFAVSVCVRIIFALIKGGVDALLQLIFHPLHSLAVIFGFLIVVGIIGLALGV